MPIDMASFREELDRPEREGPPGWKVATSPSTDEIRLKIWELLLTENKHLRPSTRFRV